MELRFLAPIQHKSEGGRERDHVEKWNDEELRFVRATMFCVESRHGDGCDLRNYRVSFA